MGGLAGHMYHLYDNPSLTFGEIKDIFRKAANGELVGTEKTDGQNLFISYSVRSGTARAARNKGNIKSGGLTPEQLAEKFEGRGQLKEAFVDAFSAFEQAVKRFSIEDQIDIFGPDANIYYNAEVQDPRTANVINYGVKTLNIHRVGHCEYDKATGEVVDRDLTKEFTKLESVLKDTQDKINQSEYKVVINAIRNLSRLTDDSILTNSLNRIEQLQKQTGVSDGDAIAQYLINIIDQIIQKQFPDIPDETKKELLKRMMKVKGATVVTVAKTIPKELQPAILPQIKSFIEQESEIYKKAIAPLEDIVHDFAVEMLKTLQSAFVLNNQVEIGRLKQELAAAKSAIENSSNEEAMAMLKKQFDKIKDIENISTTAEGFVFDYNGETYKFTGNFAPLNQILGLFRYGRGNIPPMQKLKEEDNPAENKTAVVVFGRFNPPTIGHEHLFNVAQSVANKEGAKLFIIPSRTVDNKKNPLTFEEKVELLNKMFPKYSGNITSNETATHVIGVAKFIYQLGFKNLKMVAGADRFDEYNTLLNKYNNSPDYAYDNIDIVSSGDRDPDSDDITGVSASKLRQAALEDDFATFKSGITKNISDDDILQLMNKIKERLTPAPKVSKKKTKTSLQEIVNFLEETILKFSIIKEEKEIKEMTGAAAVSGFSTPLGSDTEEFAEGVDGNGYKDVPGLSRRDSQLGISNKRDDDTAQKLIKSKSKEKIKMTIRITERKDFVEELKFRQLMREAIKKKFEARQNKIFQEEQIFRSIIRKLLKETEEDIVHKNTGINVLEKVMPKIIKTLRTDYMTPQSTVEQRKSFRAHILNATKNLLSAERVMDAADQEINGSSQDNDGMKVTLKQPKSPIEQHPKFIKAEPEQKPEEVDTFTLPGEDLTGRNLARESFKTVGAAIKKGYDLLADKKDQDMFYEYLITNLKLYFDLFESELNPTPEEPTTPSYEAEKEKQNAAETTPADTAETETAAPEAGIETPPAETGLEQPPVA